MSGAGKWVKKHPKESIALLALATGGIAAAPALGRRWGWVVAPRPCSALERAQERRQDC